MTPRCGTCPIAVTCQKRNNPPAICMQPDSAKSQGGYWLQIARMGRQEQALRMSTIDSEGGRNDF